MLIATFVIGGLAYYTFPLFGWQVDFIYCLLFGALISPTDPIAVLGILKSAGAPKPLATTIVGESLFNDGTAVVVFAIILGILQLGEAPTVSATAILFVQEAIGGVLFGAVLGYGVFVMMRGIDQYQVEVMLTLALVIGGAALAARLHVSAPIAMVVAGLIIGNHGRHYAMSDETRRYVDKFWELIDEILNALLFALIGLELLLLPFSWLHVAAAFAPGGAVLVSRLLTVGPAILVLRRFRGANRQVPAGTIRIPGLGWAARRRLGGAGAVPAVGAGARPDPQPDLHRGAGIDPAPGAFHRPAGASYLRRPAAGEKRGRTERSLRKASARRHGGRFRWRAIRRCPVALRCDGCRAGSSPPGRPAAGSAHRPGRTGPRRSTAGCWRGTQKPTLRLRRCADATSQAATTVTSMAGHCR